MVLQRFRGAGKQYTYSTPLPFDDVGMKAAPVQIDQSAMKSDLFGYGTNGYFGGGGAGRSGELTYDKWGAAMAYCVVPDINRAVDLLCNSIDGLPYRIIYNPTSDRKNDETVAESTDPRPRHKLLEAFREVNNDNAQSFMWESMYSLLTFGENFIEPLYSKLSRQCTGINMLNALGMNVIVVGGRIQSFIYTYPGGGGTETFQEWELVYDKTKNPFDKFRGLSKVAVTMTKVNILRDIDRFLRDYFNNNAVPDMVVSPAGENKFSDTDMTRLRDQVRNQLKGAGNQHRVFISPAAADYESLTQADLDKQFSVNDPLTRAVYRIFGIPLSMAGDDAGTQYKAGDPVRVGFYQNTIIPAAHDIAKFVTNQILPLFDGTEDQRLEFDTSEFDQISEDDNLRSTVATQNYAAGIWKRDEARVYTKQEPIGGEEGEAFYQEPMPTSQLMFNSPSPTATPAVEGDALQDEFLQAMTGDKAVVKLLPLPNKKPAAKAIASDTDQSYCVLGRFDSIQEITRMQDILRGMFQSYVDYDQVEFVEPSDFHVTLVYANSGNLAEAQDSLPLNPGAVSVMVGGLSVFDRPDGYAIHLLLRKEGSLPAVQSALAQSMESAGFELSPFSQGDAFTPHITLAYAPFDVIPFDITPFSLVMNKIELCDSSSNVSVIEQALKTAPVIPGKAIQSTADDELRAWERKATKNWKAAFEPIHLKGYLGSLVQGWIADSQGDANAIKSVFSHARDILADNVKWTDERLNVAFDTLQVFKAYTDTKEQFVKEMVKVIGAAQADETSRRAFAGSMRSALRRWGLIAFRDGMQEVGYDPESLSAKELKRFRDWQDEQSGYVTGLGAEVFKVGITENEVAIRARMWADNSLQAIRLQGITAGKGTQRLVWKLGQVENHCSDCLVLNGQVHTADEWDAKGIRPGNGKTVCKQGCDCSMELTDKEVSGSWL